MALNNLDLLESLNKPNNFWGLELIQCQLIGFQNSETLKPPGIRLSLNTVT